MSWSVEEAEDYAAGLEEGIAALHDELNELREIQALTVERAEHAEATLDNVYEDLGEQYRRAEKAEAALVKARSVNDVLRRALHEATDRATRAEKECHDITRDFDCAARDWAADQDRATAELMHWEERATNAETRAAAWWEAAKFYYRTGRDYAEWLRKARADRDAAEDANKYLARDLRHSREAYEALSESWDRLQDDWEFQAKMNQKNAQELIELKKALRTLGGDRD